MAKQTTDLQSLETVLLRAREIAEELGEVVTLYFIDMSLAQMRSERDKAHGDLDYLDGSSSGLTS